MHNLTEVDNFDTNVTVPDALVDARRASSVETPFQAVTNRSRWAKNRIDEILAQFAASLSVQDLVADGDIHADGSIDADGDISAPTGTVSAGTMSVGIGGLVSTGPLLVTTLLGGTFLATDFKAVADQAGATKTAGPKFGLDFDGTIFLISAQTALGKLKLPATPEGGSPGTIVMFKLNAFSANGMAIAQSDGTTIVTLSAGQFSLLMYDGFVWQELVTV